MARRTALASVEDQHSEPALMLVVRPEQASAVPGFGCSGAGVPSICPVRLGLWDRAVGRARWLSRPCVCP
jgi:hypothetical protein